MGKFEHLMLDLETMGDQSFSSILSIGALEFDINTGETGKEFYINIDLQSCIDLGLTINANTVMWWLQQNDQARKDLVEKTRVSIEYALLEFAKFCNKGYQIWANSPRFDCGILQNAYDKANIPIPWDFRKERCVRTLVSFKPEIKNNFEYDGVLHNALSDCYYQAKCCSLIWQTLNNIEPNTIGKYVIIDLRNMDFMKNEEGKINYYDSEEEACKVCGMYEFENVWVMKLIYNYIEMI